MYIVISSTLLRGKISSTNKFCSLHESQETDCKLCVMDDILKDIYSAAESHCLHVIRIM